MFSTWDENLILHWLEFLIHFLKIKMVSSLKHVLTWADDKLVNLIQYLQEFKSYM